MQLRWATWCWFVGVGATFHILLTGCASSSTPGGMAHESSKGAVFLEPLPDKSQHATHPIKIYSTVIALVLRGVQIQEQPTMVQSLFSSEPKIGRAFSDEDIEFLAPLLTKTLARATSSQQVIFRVIHPTPAGTETTGGTLYVDGPSLYVTLTQYRVKPRNSEIIMQPRGPPDSTGLDSREVRFIPAAARIPEAEKSSGLRGGLLGEPRFTTLAIKYELLENLADRQVEPVPPPAAQVEKAAAKEEQGKIALPRDSGSARPAEPGAPNLDELRRVKDLVIKKDLEMEALKDEVRGLRQQLRERDADVQALRSELDSLKKKAPSPRP